MRECGIDITGEFPKPWANEIIQEADVIITISGGDAYPIVPGKRSLNWDIDDPADLDIETVRPIRDEIERRVHRLLDQLSVPPHA